MERTSIDEAIAFLDQAIHQLAEWIASGKKMEARRYNEIMLQVRVLVPMVEHLQHARSQAAGDAAPQ